jgi:hypothetical protein
LSNLSITVEEKKTKKAGSKKWYLD